MKRVRQGAAVAAVALITTALLSACTGTTPNAAVVDGTAISQSTLLRELHALSSNQAFVTSYNTNVQQQLSQGQFAYPITESGTASTTYTQGFAAIVLNTDIQAVLAHQEVVRRHLEPSPAEIAAQTVAAAAQQQFATQADPTGHDVFVKFDPWFQQEWKARTAEQIALAKALGPAASDAAAVKAYYSDNPAQYVQTQCVSDIFVPTEALAAKVRSDLVAGTKFADEARRYSKDLTSAIKGGDLGCNAPSGDGTAYDVDARTIALNTLSQPVYSASTLGWHVFLVRSRQMYPLTTVSPSIQQGLQSAAASYGLLVDKALKSAKVSINPGYGTWDAMAHIVVPPVAPAPSAGAPTPAPASP